MTETVNTVSCSGSDCSINPFMRNCAILNAIIYKKAALAASRPYVYKPRPITPEALAKVQEQERERFKETVPAALNEVLPGSYCILKYPHKPAIIPDQDTIELVKRLREEKLR